MATNNKMTEDISKMLESRPKKFRRGVPLGEQGGEQTESTEKTGNEKTGSRAYQDNKLKKKFRYTSLYLDSDLYEQVRQIAKRNSLSYSEIINAAMRKYIELYEAKNGPIVPVRESKISADSIV